MDSVVAQARMVLLVLLLGPIVAGCGSPSQQTAVPFQFLNDGQVGATTGGELRDTIITVSGATITPSDIPPEDAGVREIDFSARVTFTVALNRSLQYNKNNWGLRFVSPAANGPEPRLYRVKSQEKNFEVIEDGLSPSSESTVLTGEASGDMVFKIRLAEDEWSQIWRLAQRPEGQRRTQIKVQLVYSIRDTIGTGDTDGTAIRDAVTMQNDVGWIRGAPALTVRGTSAGAVTLELKGPNDLTAELPAERYAAIGPSQLSGYLVLYWKEGDCQQSGWNFQTNPQTRIQASDPNPLLECTYPSLDALLAAPGSCPLGCGAEPLPGLFPREDGTEPTGDQVANPLDSGACYRTVVVKPGRASVSVTGLENNTRYGFVAWPLDSAKTPGAARSSCVDAVPVKVPMAASGDTSASVRDCFVASAASGDPSSLTVHYWRIVRDRLLDPLSLSPVYYRHAPRWAAWLEEHPQWKAPINAVLLHSGRWIVAVDESVTAAWAKTQWFLSRLRLAAANAWDAVAMQLDGDAQGAGAEASDDVDALPPSKGLRSLEAITADDRVADQKPTKSLPAAGGAGAADAAAPTKKLPPAGELGSQDDVPSKALPPLSTEAYDPNAKEPRAYPEGSGAATTRLMGGVFVPDASPLWDGYYPTGSPTRLAVQQTFRVADTMGEWGLGFTGSFQFHTGRVPKTLPDGSDVLEAIQGRKIGYYSTGFYLTGDYRFRYMPAPPLTVRLSASFGGERLRETADEVKAEETAGSDDGKRDGKFGYTLLKPMALAGASLEISLGALFGAGFSSTTLGYGARDILLAADAYWSRDLSDHKFSQSGRLLGGSLVFLLE